MKKIKVFSLVIMLVLTISFFCGCSSVTYSVTQYPNGKISQTFQANLNKTLLLGQGLNEEDVTNLETKVKNVLEAVLDRLIVEFRAEAQEIYKNDIVNYAKVITKVENGLTKGVAVNNDIIIAEFLFEDYTTYKYFYNIEENSSSSTEKQQTFLYNINLTKSVTPFATFENSTIFTDAIIEIENYLKANNIQNLSGQIFNKNDLSFNYSYAVPANANMHSDADYKVTKNGLTFHVWEMDSNNLTREVVLYTLTPRTYIWYALALTFTLILMLVLFIVCKVKDKKIKKDEKNEEIFSNNIDFKNESDIINE